MYTEYSTINPNYPVLIKSVYWRHGSLVAYVQDSKLSKKLSRELDKLSIPNHPSSHRESFNDGDRVLVRRSSPSGHKFVRALVVSHNQNIVSVLCLETGQFHMEVAYEDVFDSKYLKSNELISAPGAQPCIVDGFKADLEKNRHVDPRSLEHVLDLYANKQWWARTLAIVDDNVPLVDLKCKITKLSIQHLSDCPVKFVQKPRDARPLVYINAREEVLVTQDERTFIGVQLNRLPIDDLHRFESELLYEIISGEVALCNKETLNEGGFVACPHDGTFCRGYVTRMKDRTATVYMVDYGYSEKFLIKRLRLLPEMFIDRIPAYGMIVDLQNDHTDEIDDTVVLLDNLSRVHDYRASGRLAQTGIHSSTELPETATIETGGGETEVSLIEAKAEEIFLEDKTNQDVMTEKNKPDKRSSDNDEANDIPDASADQNHTVQSRLETSVDGASNTSDFASMNRAISFESLMRSPGNVSPSPTPSINSVVEGGFLPPELTDYLNFDDDDSNNYGDDEPQTEQNNALDRVSVDSQKDTSILDTIVEEDENVSKLSVVTDKLGEYSNDSRTVEVQIEEFEELENRMIDAEELEDQEKVLEGIPDHEQSDAKSGGNDENCGNQVWKDENCTASADGERSEGQSLEEQINESVYRILGDGDHLEQTKNDESSVDQQTGFTEQISSEEQFQGDHFDQVQSHSDYYPDQLENQSDYPDQVENQSEQIEGNYGSENYSDYHDQLESCVDYIDQQENYGENIDHQENYSENIDQLDGYGEENIDQQTYEYTAPNQSEYVHEEDQLDPASQNHDDVYDNMNPSDQIEVQGNQSEAIFEAPEQQDQAVTTSHEVQCDDSNEAFVCSYDESEAAFGLEDSAKVAEVDVSEGTKEPTQGISEEPTRQPVEVETEVAPIAPELVNQGSKEQVEVDSNTNYELETGLENNKVLALADSETQENEGQVDTGIKITEKISTTQSRGFEALSSGISENASEKLASKTIHRNIATEPAQTGTEKRTVIIGHRTDAKSPKNMETKPNNGFDVRGFCEYPKLTMGEKKYIEVKVLQKRHGCYLLVLFEPVLEKIQLCLQSIPTEIFKNDNDTQFVEGEMVLVKHEDSLKRALVGHKTQVDDVAIYYVYLIDQPLGFPTTASMMATCPPAIVAIPQALMYVKLIDAKQFKMAVTDQSCGLVVESVVDSTLHGYISHRITSV